MRQIIETEKAPAAIGSYSPAVKAGNTLYLSGQIPLEPITMTLVSGDARAEVNQIFDNIKAVTEAASGTLNDIVKLTVYLTDFALMPAVNEAIADYFAKPYPARTSIQVVALPKGARVEIEAIMFKL